MKIPGIDHEIKIAGDTGVKPFALIPGSLAQMHERNKKFCQWYRANPQHETCKRCHLLRPGIYKACYEYPIAGSENPRPDFVR